MIALLNAASREPSRPLEAEDFFEHGTFFPQQVVKRAWLDRPAGEAVEVREGDFVAQAIIFPGLDHLPWFFRVVSEAARIVLAHRDVGSTMHHPPGQLARQPRAPADADLGAAAAPVISDAGCRTDHGVAVRRMANGAVYLAGDAQFRKDRHPLHRILQPGHDAVIVRVEQFVLRFPGAMIFPDRVGILFFVDPDQAFLLFHADIA